MNSKIQPFLVSRFQVPSLSNHHHDLLRYFINTYAGQLPIIVLGLAALPSTKENPLDFELRKKMILQEYPNITVLYIKDNRDDHKWSEQLDTLIKQNCESDVEPIVYGNYYTVCSKYTGQYKTHTINREIFVDDKITRSNPSKIHTKDFRDGVIWGINQQYDSVFSVVDVIPYDPETKSILLGKKPGETKWRFIGGFVDKGETLEMAAKRELREEAGSFEVDEPKYIGSIAVNDWRYENERNGITSSVFLCKYLFGKPIPGDDIEAVAWFGNFVYENFKQNLVEEHWKILNLLNAYFEKNK